MTIPVLVLVAVQAAAQPAATTPPKPFDCTGPEYRQFDFWIGDWDLRVNPDTRPPNPSPPASGNQPMRNRIEKAQDGCLIIENFDDQRGGTGQSFNVFDRVKRQWHQTWVDSRGGLHEYWGELKDGKMVLLGDVPLGPGQTAAGRRTLRVTFVPLGPDKMRQYAESLMTDGQWASGYDFIYTRRSQTP